MTEILLEDTIETTFVPVLEEGSDKPVKWVGKFAQCDSQTSNKRKYSRKLWENVLSRPEVKQKLESGMIGVLNHPADGETDLFRSAIATKKLTIEQDGSITGEAKIIPIGGGEILKKLIASGVKVGVSSRGRGSVDEDGNVNEDYTLIAFDVVDNPAVATAIPNVSESEKIQQNKKPDNRRSDMSGYDKYYAIETNVRPTLNAIEEGNIDESLKGPLDAILKGALKELGELTVDESANLITPVAAALQNRIIKCRELLEKFDAKAIADAKVADAKVNEGITNPKVIEVSLDALKDAAAKKGTSGDTVDNAKKIDEMTLESLKIHTKELDVLLKEMEEKYNTAVASLEELKNLQARAVVDEAIEKAYAEHPELAEAKELFEGVDTVEGVTAMVERLMKLTGKSTGAKTTTDDGKPLPKSGGGNSKVDEKVISVTKDDDLDEDDTNDGGYRVNEANDYTGLMMAMEANKPKPE